MYKNDIREYLNYEIAIMKKLDVQSINNAMQLIYETYLNRGNIYIFGNGGSASTASHYQNDFNKGISEYVDTKFKFICLNDNVATLMAIANDLGFGEVFRFQLKNKLYKNDIIIAISGSGNSINVINAVKYAKSCGNKIIGLTGFDGGELALLSDISLHVPTNSMQITEDIHMIFDHLMMAIFYKSICGKNHIKK